MIPPLRLLEWTFALDTAHPALLLLAGLSSFGFTAALVLLGVGIDSPWPPRKETSIKERKR